MLLLNVPGMLLLEAIMFGVCLVVLLLAPGLLGGVQSNHSVAMNLLAVIHLMVMIMPCMCVYACICFDMFIARKLS